MEIYNYNSYQEYLDEQMKASVELQDRDNVDSHISALNDVKQKVLYGIFNKFEMNNVLCVGARNCSEVFALNKVFAGSNMNIRAIDLIGRKLQGCEIEAMDMHNMSIPHSSIDFIYAHHILEHSPMPDVVAGEMVRAIKNNGIIYIIIPMRYAPTKRDCVAFRAFYDVHDLFKYRVVETIYQKIIKAPEGSKLADEMRIAFRIKKLE